MLIAKATRIWNPVHWSYVTPKQAHKLNTGGHFHDRLSRNPALKKPGNQPKEHCRQLRLLSHMACALGIAACRNFLKVKYIRLPELLNDLAVARGEGTYKKVIGQYKKVDLLILDEGMLIPLSEHEARDLLEIIEIRHKHGSTIFASQLSP